MTATFLPWYETGYDFAVPGFELLDVWVTLGFFLFVIIFAFIGARKEPLAKSKFYCMIAGAMNLLIGVLNITNIYNSIDDAAVETAVIIGAGMYVLLSAGFALCILPFIRFEKSKTPKKDKITKQLEKNLDKFKEYY
jgi:hypothetical protein